MAAFTVSTPYRLAARCSSGRFPPGSASGTQPYTHRGEEGGLVLEGMLELWIENEKFLLNAGDSFSFPSTKPHRYRNPSKRETVVLWVITPPTY
jgi:quercetin dioxygenase-like cupin family protein